MGKSIGGSDGHKGWTASARCTGASNVGAQGHVGGSHGGLPKHAGGLVSERGGHHDVVVGSGSDGGFTEADSPLTEGGFCVEAVAEVGGID